MFVCTSLCDNGLACPPPHPSADLVSASSTDGKVAWYSGFEPLTLDLFGNREVPVSTMDNPASNVTALFVGDINGDLCPDVLYGGGSVVAWCVCSALRPVVAR